MSDWNDLSIDELELSVRTVNLLHLNGVHTCGGLMYLDLEEVKSWRGVGHRTRSEIRGIQQDRKDDIRRGKEALTQAFSPDLPIAVERLNILVAENDRLSFAITPQGRLEVRARVV